MKKLIVFALLIFLFPIVTFGLEINKVELNGVEEVSNKNTFTVDVDISFTDLSKESTDYGIFAIEYGLSFDSSKLTPVGITANGYNSTVSDIGGDVLVTNIFDKTKEDYLCKDKTLVCTDYKATIKFEIHSDSSEPEEIKLNGLKVFTLPIEKVIITESDVKTKSYSKVVTKSIEIKDVDYTLDSYPSIVVETGKRPKIVTPKLGGTVDPNKSSNYLLKKLVIEGYDIEFVSTTNDYKIIVPEGTKEVNIECETEDPKAQYKIFGNNNLDTNNTIVVKVTAENGLENTYNIKVNKLYEEGRNLNQDGLDRAISSINLNLLVVIAGIIFVLILIVVIVDAAKSRKLEKKIDKFD